MNGTGENGQNKYHFFWRQTAPGEHFLQVYEDDRVLLDSLEGFAAAGLQAGEGVIVFATALHRFALEQRLRLLGFSLAIARSRDQYLVLDAEETLSKLMVDGQPDETLFRRLVSDLVARAGANGRNVRAFGEMVALLWNRGQRGATLQLENFWHRFRREQSFALFCAYPRSGFAGDSDSSFTEIRATHSIIVE
jgi:hypothetical protein